MNGNRVQLGIKLWARGVILFAFRKRREVLDPLFLKKFAPASFDCFIFQPSVGASGDLFKGQVVFQNSFALCTEMTSLHNNFS